MSYRVYFIGSSVPTIPLPLLCVAIENTKTNASSSHKSWYYADGHYCSSAYMEELDSNNFKFHQ